MSGMCKGIKGETEVEIHDSQPSGKMMTPTNERKRGSSQLSLAVPKISVEYFNDLTSPNFSGLENDKKHESLCILDVMTVPHVHPDKPALMSENHNARIMDVSAHR